MAWVRVRDLGAISSASKGNLAPRDCIYVADPLPGRPVVRESGGARRACHGEIRNGRDQPHSLMWSRLALCGARGSGSFSHAFELIAAKTVHLGIMRHRAPYATTSTNQTKPGRSGYLRGVLCVLHQSVSPLGADIAAAPSAQSRRNLGVARCRQIPRDCAQIAHLHPGQPEALQCNGGRRALPGDI